MQTISLLGYLHEFRGITGPHMVVAPKSTLGNWMNEIRRFCPVLRAIKFLGNPEERVNLNCFPDYAHLFNKSLKGTVMTYGVLFVILQQHIRENLLVPGKFDVCVTSFEMAIKEKTALRRFSWRYIIIDEAHRIKNENSLLSKTMRIYNTNYRLLITGTPLQVIFAIRTIRCHMLGWDSSLGSYFYHLIWILWSELIHISYTCWFFIPLLIENLNIISCITWILITMNLLLWSMHPLESAFSIWFMREVRDSAITMLLYVVFFYY